MEALSIIELPEYKKKEYSKNVLWVSIDYKRFNLKSRKVLEGLLLNAHRANNETNSNTVYDGEVAYMRVNSPRGVAHKVVLAIENVGPTPFCYIEVYGQWQWLHWSVAKIDFYGAFFHFIENIPKRYLQLYSYLRDLAIEQPAVCRVTRVDIALDFEADFPQNWWSWIKPCKLSKRDVSAYRHHGKYNSYWYLSNKNSWYGVRMYNKLVDITKPWSNKVNWYGGEEKLPKKWTRIEFEFYPPYSLMDDDELMQLCWDKVVNKWEVQLWLKYRPNFEFKVEKAYLYFDRYAKNHGITIERLIDELIEYHTKIEALNEVLSWQSENNS